MALHNIEQLRQMLPDEFSSTLVDGGVAVLQTANPIRAHLFAAALREAVGHLLHKMAPDEEVTEACWFVQQADRPTRRQRATFAVQGGLADEIVENIGIDASEMHGELATAISALNRSTHVRPKTLLTEPREIDAFANQVVDAVLEFLEIVGRLRSSLAEAVAAEASKPVFGKFLQETDPEIDLISTHSYVEQADVEEVSVTHIGAHEIIYRAEGTVYVELNFGSGSDRARGEGATMNDNFPFSCSMTGSVKDFKEIYDVSDLEVDTTSWYE